MVVCVHRHINDIEDALHASHTVLQVEPHGSESGCRKGNLKEKGIQDYKYSIAIENSSQENYFTEKIIDCLLLWSMPIYWGCPNISNFFPEHSFYEIELEKPQEIHSIIERPIEKKNIEAMKEARNLILNKYNIWAVIESLL